VPCDACDQRAAQLRGNFCSSRGRRSGPARLCAPLSPARRHSACVATGNQAPLHTAVHPCRPDHDRAGAVARARRAAALP